MQNKQVHRKQTSGYTVNQLSVQFSSVAQSCPTPCDPMNCSTPGLPVHHQLLEFTQTHVHWVCDAIQPSYPLSSPSPPASNPSQHQSLFPMSQLFAWGGQSIGVSALASVLPMNIQDWFLLGLTGLISLLSKGFSRVLQHHSSKASIIWCSPILQCSSILQLDLEKAEKTEINMPTSTGSQKKQESSRKNIYFCFIDYTKAFVWITTNWKILQQMGIPDHLTCLLTNLYVGQEATVRTGHGTTVWFQIGKGVRQGCILSPCLFNLYAGYIMWNARLDEVQAGIKIAGRNINNLR